MNEAAKPEMGRVKMSVVLKALNESRPTYTRKIAKGIRLPWVRDGLGRCSLTASEEKLQRAAVQAGVPDVLLQALVRQVVAHRAEVRATIITLVAKEEYAHAV